MAQRATISLGDGWVDPCEWRGMWAMVRRRLVSWFMVFWVVGLHFVVGADHAGGGEAFEELGEVAGVADAGTIAGYPPPVFSTHPSAPGVNGEYNNSRCAAGE